MEKINDFLKVSILYGNGDGNGYGNGYGDGDGNGYGDGDGNGYGNGNGDGDGNGYGNGNGDGNGYGDGDGNGYGNGNGDGDGNGYGNGNGDGIINFCNNIVYKIDNLQTIIYSIKNNIAKGAILNNDLSLTDCYIIKNENYFAHGKTIKEAFKSLEEKILQNLPIEELINKFKEFFKNFNKKYSAKILAKWHHNLTGSCELGINNFCLNNNININKDKFTVYEFIEITKNSYNGEIIKKLL